MNDQLDHASIVWRAQNVPISAQFDDPYFNISDGLAETRHVFLAGNNLPMRFGRGFHIAELGFGTGLNLLAVWCAWRKAGVGGALRFTSFELQPMGLDDMARASTAWPELATLSDELIARLRANPNGFDAPDLQLRLIVGDARQTLPKWNGCADTWFLDGFSPAKNPQLWEVGLMRHVYRCTKSGGSFATYSAAGAVRQALNDAGFHVNRTAGFGRKRHMCRGVKP